MKNLIKIATITLFAISYCENTIDESWADAQQKEAVVMTMSPVTAGDYGGSVPVASISCPEAGEDVKAEDIRAPVAALLAEAADIRSDVASGLNAKVDIVGDTMTGKLTINEATDNALEATTASTTLPAIVAVSGGTGISAQSGNNAPGVSATGHGIGAGVSAVGGASAPGVLALPGTASTTTAPAYALRLAAGGMHMDGVVSPNADVDPGFNFAIFPQNTVTARAFVTTDSGGDVLGGFNTASFARSAVGVGTITFKRALPGDEYSLAVTPPDGYLAAENIAGRSTTQCQFVVRNATTNAVVDLTATVLKFSIIVTGY